MTSRILISRKLPVGCIESTVQVVRRDFQFFSLPFCPKLFRTPDAKSTAQFITIAGPGAYESRALSPVNIDARRVHSREHDREWDEAVSLVAQERSEDADETPLS